MILLKIVRMILIMLLLMLGVGGILVATAIDTFLKQPTSVLALAKLWYRTLLLIMNVRVQSVGRYTHQGALVCSNHISWLDIPVLGSVLPSYFLSKAELRSVPVLGWLAHHAGTLFIERGGKQITQVKALMQAYLSQDHCLTFFPEATTGNGYAIRQFHPRLFSAAIETSTPILPVALEYRCQTQPELKVAFGDESMATNLWRVLGRWRTDVTVTLLPTLQTEDMERKVLADTAMHMIADVLNLPHERRGLNFRAPLPSDPPSLD